MNNAAQTMDDTTYAPGFNTVVHKGETWEGHGFRVHCYAGSIRITELGNAGKRGKKCRELSIMFPWGKSAEPATRFYVGTLLSEGFDGAVVFARDAEVDGLVAVSVDELRGVDVPTAKADGPVKLSARDFRDLCDSVGYAISSVTGCPLGEDRAREFARLSRRVAELRGSVPSRASAELEQIKASVLRRAESVAP